MRSLGCVVLLCGIALVVAGIWLALSPLIGLYASALSDPMSGDDDGKATGFAMVKGLVVGGAGLPVLAAGTATVWRAAARSRRERLERSRRRR